jgi:hypothetical protein
MHKVQQHKKVQRARRRHRAHERKEGAVLLVVLLVIMVATASAATSVSNTQSEIRAVGQERAALHGRYAAEAAMVATLGWLDDLDARGRLGAQYKDWQTKSETGVFPEMRTYGERQVNLTNRISGRVLQANQTFTAPPVGYVGAEDAINPTGATPPPAGAGGTAGTGGAGGVGGAAGGTPSSADPINSVGPNQRYAPAPYIVDVTECTEAPSTSVAGSDASADEEDAFYVRCTLTSRAQLLYGDSTTRTWSFDGLNNFTLPRYSTKHAARAEVILGPIHPE